MMQDSSLTESMHAIVQQTQFPNNQPQTITDAAITNKLNHFRILVPFSTTKSLSGIRSGQVSIANCCINTGLSVRRVAVAFTRRQCSVL